MLAALEEDQSEADVLRLALHQAIADLGGLGGFVHLRGPGGSRRLRLTTAAGLPPDISRLWGDIAWDAALAPAVAAQRNTTVWQPADEVPSGYMPPAGTGVVAVPLPGPDLPLGVLSVVTVLPGPQTSARYAFLAALTRWLSDELRRPAAAGQEVRPVWWQDESPSAPGLHQAAFNAVHVGTWDWDIRTGEVVWDEVMLRVLGIEPGSFDGRVESWVALVHPEDLPWVLAGTEQAIHDRGEYGSEYRVCRRDGTTGWVEARGRVVVGEDGEPARMMGTLWDITETRLAMDAAGRALRHMSDGFLAVDAEWRISFVNVRAEQLLGSSHRIVGQTLWDIGEARGSGIEQRCRSAAARRAPVGFEVRWPGDGRWYHVRLVPVPDGQTLYFTDVTERRQRDAERAAEERATAERAARVEELTRALSRAITVDEVVSAVAERVLPPFGATGLLMMSVEGDELHLVGAFGFPEAFRSRLVEVMTTGGSASREVLRTGVPQYFTSVSEYADAHPRTADLPALAQMSAGAVLPLIVSGHAIGCCVLSFDTPRAFGKEERTLLGALGGLIAQALERARLYDAEHARAQALQRGLLPSTLPSVPALTAAARYLPAADEGIQVGGDWYDLIPLSSDRVALVIGDVMGHGVSEAATMGRLRTAVHTLAGLELPPDELLATLNDLVSGFGDDFYATCLYAVYDPAEGTCTMASAGHPPPAVVDPTGTISFPDLPANPPLGAGTPPFETAEFRLSEGSLIVAYTDGLIESSLRDIDTGMDLLAETIGRHLSTASAPRPNGGREPVRPELAEQTEQTKEETDEANDEAEAERLLQLCDSLTSTLIPTHGRADDDAAVLVARTRVLADRDIASWTLPEDPVAAGEARAHVRRQLAEWLLEDLVMTTEIVVSELVGNVIRHARGPIRLRLLRSRTLICEVSDGSLTTPRIRHAGDTDEGGRGLQLVSALCQRWGTRYTSDGKSIWTEQPLLMESHTLGEAALLDVL
ncbi:SpoIIE family protein phosphatase [Streptomyces sp. NPDC057253]|uniref:SpoIIE family protein phosphatase n=1 Tax=Streptomyces sp. NPDC057253 TaxID=3346069 RepID=UPI00362AC344